MTERPSAWELARIACEACDGLAAPDTSESAGSVFLEHVWDAWQDREAYGYDDGEDDELIHAIADAVVPVYSYPIWATYVDLCAYRVDMSEYADGINLSEPTALERHAGATLYVVARLMLEALARSEVAT